VSLGVNRAVTTAVPAPITFTDDPEMVRTLAESELYTNDPGTLEATVGATSVKESPTVFDIGDDQVRVGVVFETGARSPWVTVTLVVTVAVSEVARFVGVNSAVTVSVPAARIVKVPELVIEIAPPVDAV
jgi:hypothetical protein